ncbi:MAG TPA: HAD family hydrolase [Candidatus Dormibacteraeota bacterium]|nr:HAD family hydrolase [Candidatus Dormibacteraeota bacterium]
MPQPGRLGGDEAGAGVVSGERVPPPIAVAPLPASRPRIVLLDLDGTCLDLRDQSLHPRTRDAVRAAVRSGATVVIASGRMYRSALPWARELQVTAPLVCYQGAVVRAMPREGDPLVDGVPLGELLFEDGLQPDVALHALRVARDGGWHRQAYQDEQLLCEEDRPEAHLYAQIADVPITFVDDLEARLQRGSTKFVCVVDGSPGVDECEQALHRALDATARVKRSLPQFVEVTDRRAGKGNALRRLCERLGVDLRDSVAVGDAPNDADMLEAAGYAVAVAGAPPELLGIADAVCGGPAEAGVAAVLERLGLA